MTEHYKSEFRTTKEFLDNIPREVFERQAIAAIVSKIPIEKLKKLFNLRQIGHEDEEFWENETDKYFSKDIILFKCDIKL
jgi:hypothetical protein